MAEAEVPLVPEKTSRTTLPHFVRYHLEKENIPGFSWFEKGENTWRLPWKIHRATIWGEPDAMVLHAWAEYKYNYQGQHPSTKELRKWKENLRNAISTNPFVKELEHLHKQGCDQPYKVYQFVCRRDTKAINSTTSEFERDLSNSSEHDQALERRAPFKHQENLNVPNFDFLAMPTSPQQNSPSGGKSTELKNIAPTPVHTLDGGESSQSISDVLDELMISQEEDVYRVNGIEKQLPGPHVTGLKPIQDENSQSISDVLRELTGSNEESNPLNQETVSYYNIDCRESAQTNETQLLPVYARPIPAPPPKLFDHTDDFRSRSPVQREEGNFMFDQSICEIVNRQPENFPAFEDLVTHINENIDGAHSEGSNPRGPAINSGLDFDAFNQFEDLRLPVEFGGLLAPIPPTVIGTTDSDTESFQPLSVSIDYCSKTLVSDRPVPDNFKLCFVKNNSMRDCVIHCPTTEQFGPNNALLIELPHPEECMQFSAQEANNLWKVLENMQRGITLSTCNGDIFATRYCKATAYFAIHGSQPVKLERRVTVKIFDFQEHFLPQFNGEQWLSMEPQVKISFGVKTSIRIEVVNITIKHMQALRMIKEKKHKELQVSLEPDCSLSSQFDTRLTIEQDLRNHMN